MAIIEPWPSATAYDARPSALERDLAELAALRKENERLRAREKDLARAIDEYRAGSVFKQLDEAHEDIKALCDERREMLTVLRAVLARDAEFAPSGSKDDCGCIRLHYRAEKEYEAGKCPHQIARAALPHP